MNLRDKTVLITGGGQGIGFGIAERVVSFGASVVLLDINEEQLDTAKRKLNNPEVYVHRVNVTDTEEVNRTVMEIAEKHKTIDGLVNAAGIMKTVTFEEINIEDWRKIIDVNLTGTFIMMKAVHLFMKKQRFGSIVNMSSTAGRRCRPFSPAYAASKAGVENLTRSSGVALAPEGIRVNAVLPGVIHTPMMDSIIADRSALWNQTKEEVTDNILRTIPMQQMGHPHDIGNMVCFLLSDLSKYTTAECIAVAGGYDV